VEDGARQAHTQPRRRSQGGSTFSVELRAPASRRNGNSELNTRARAKRNGSCAERSKLIRAARITHQALAQMDLVASSRSILAPTANPANRAARNVISVH
jgi:hypothetical protein